MDALVYLIPAALILGLLGLGGFLWALKSGQFDDLEGEASRILDDDDLPRPSGDTPRPPADNPPAGDRGPTAS